MPNTQSPAGPPLTTIRTAASLLGLKYHALLKAVNDGVVPSYRPFNSRRLVRLAEIEAIVAANRTERGQ